MKILLIAMPDTIPLFFAYQSRIPHLGLCSLVANIATRGCKIKTLDLTFYPTQGLIKVKQALKSFRPHLVGLTAMSFQYKSAHTIAQAIRQFDANIKIALGGYHATLMYDEIARGEENSPFDFIIKGEGEFTFKELVRELFFGGNGFEKIEGLSFRDDGTFIHNPARKLVNLEEIKLPERNSSLFNKMHHGAFGRAEAVETSRGCLMDCEFCSINKMYGKQYRAFPIERVIEDIKRTRKSGAVRIMFSDDNLTLDTRRLERLCERIVEEGLNDIWYGTEASCKGIASNENLVKKMREANFGVVFLGIESISRKTLLELGKGDIREDTLRAIHLLKKNDIGVMGGFILGNPCDNENDIKKVFKFSKHVGVDFLMSQILTPYPKTRIRETLLGIGMVENTDDYSIYNGYGCNVRTSYLSRNRLRRLVVWENIKWFFMEIFNRHNWFASSKRVKKHTYLMVLIMTIRLIFRFVVGGFAKSTHSLR